MTHAKDFSSSSDDANWERIKQLEAELKLLYQSVSKSDNRSASAIGIQPVFFESLSNAVILCGLDFTIKSWNLVATETYGYTQVEAIGQDIRTLLYSSPLHATWNETELELQTNGHWQGEIEHLHHDGHDFISTVFIMMVLDDNHIPSGFLFVQQEAILQYIQEHAPDLKEANQNLQKSQQWYQALIRNFPNGIVGLVNHDLRFEIMGGEGEINLPFQGDELVGRGLADIMPPDIVERDEPYLRAALEGEAHVQTVEYKGGHFHVHTLPITDDEGNVISAMVMSQDISELVQAQEIIKENEEHYRMLFHSIPDMVFILNQEMNFVLANQALADWFSTTTETIKGRNLRDFLHNFEDTVFYQSYQESLQDGHPRVVIGQYTTKSLNNWYEARVLPFQNNLLIIKRDITSQRQSNQRTLQDELARSRSNARDEIVHNLAHDLRTPLSTIHTSLYLLERYTDPQKQQQKLEGLKRQVNHLENMIENILLLTELDAYQPEDLTSTDIRQLVIDLGNSFKKRIEDNQLHLSVEAPPDSLYFRVHIQHIIRALTHIVDNAVIYSQPDGEIHISLHQSTPESFTITIEDTGIGIEPENLPHIFERFYRANQARTMNDAGNGLGLTIAQQIIELHHGNISVTSELHEGTTVIVTI